VMRSSSHFIRVGSGLVSLAGVVGFLGAAPAAAQISGAYTFDSAARTYFVQGNATINGDLTLNPATKKPYSDGLGNDVFIGKDNASSFKTLSGAHTVNIVAPANVDIYNNGGDPDGSASMGSYNGITVFGQNTVNMTGGFSTFITATDTSTVNLNGGSVDWASGGNTSLLNISKGTFGYAYAYASTTVNISGGNFFGFVQGSGGTINLSGGGFADGVHMYGSKVVTNIYGTNLGYVYSGYDAASSFDHFTITGDWADNSPFSFDVQLYNSTGVANSTKRQFNLIPIVIPEGNSALLLAAGAPLFGIVLTLRRNRRQGQ